MTKRVVVFIFLSWLVNQNLVFSQSVSDRLKTSKDEIIVTCSEVNFGENTPKKNANSISLIWSDSKKTVRIITDDKLYSNLGKGMSATDNVARRLYIGKNVEINSAEIIFLTDADHEWRKILWMADRSSAILQARNPDNTPQVFNTYKCIKGSSRLD